MLIENNMAALRREFEDAGIEFIDLGRTEVPGVRLESEMGRSEMRPSRLALTSAPCYPLNAAAQSPAFSVQTDALPASSRQPQSALIYPVAITHLKANATET